MVKVIDDNWTHFCGVLYNKTPRHKGLIDTSVIERPEVKVKNVSAITTYQNYG